jgi:hypothetical protein
MNRQERREPDDRQLGPEERASAVELRAELAEGLLRWRHGLASVGPGPTTYAFGPASRPVALGNALLRAICVELLPDVRFPARPTVGQRVDKLRRNADRAVFDCTESDRPMLTPSELDLIAEFGRNRAALAHHEDRLDDAGLIGRVSVEDCLELLDLVERIAGLEVVEELVCRERGRS